MYIEPGHPWENPYCESFNGKLRDECLIRELTLDYNAGYAQVVIERWRKEYNEERPHSSLGYRTPAEVARDRVVAGRPLAEDTRLTPQVAQVFGGKVNSITVPKVRGRKVKRTYLVKICDILGLDV